MTSTPPGWYDDGHGAMRWWDGTQWTEHVAQPDAEASDAPTEAEILAGAPAAAPQEGYAQGVYPGTPAGAAPAGGAFAAATEPRAASKLWILWVVLGVVLLGIVIAAAVVIPLLLLSASSANTTGGSDAERAAVATVGVYDEAWQEGDCDKLAAATTESFRSSVDLTDCAAFEEQAAAFSTGIEDYTVNITDVETVGDEIIVTTNETYTALVDDNGDPTEPTDSAVTYEYTVVESDGDWLIESVDSE